MMSCFLAWFQGLDKCVEYLMMQVENEYGLYGRQTLRAIKQMMLTEALIAQAYIGWSWRATLGEP